MFNNFFADQYSILRNKSEFFTTLSRKTRESLTAIDFSDNNVIRNLDPNKGHGHDMITIRIVKICDEFVNF